MESRVVPDFAPKNPFLSPPFPLFYSLLECLVNRRATGNSKVNGARNFVPVFKGRIRVCLINLVLIWQQRATLNQLNEWM